MNIHLRTRSESRESSRTHSEEHKRPKENAHVRSPPPPLPVAAQEQHASGSPLSPLLLFVFSLRRVVVARLRALSCTTVAKWMVVRRQVCINTDPCDACACARALCGGQRVCARDRRPSTRGDGGRRHQAARRLSPPDELPVGRPWSGLCGGGRDVWGDQVRHERDVDEQIDARATMHA